MITGDHTLIRGLAGTPVEEWVRVLEP